MKVSPFVLRRSESYWISSSSLRCLDALAFYLLLLMPIYPFFSSELLLSADVG